MLVSKNAFLYIKIVFGPFIDQGKERKS